MNKKIFYAKILVVFVLTYFVSQLLTKEVFIAGSPKVRPNVGQYLVSRTKEIFSDTIQPLANLFYRTPEDQLKNIPLQTVAKGVYAKSDKNISYTLIKEGEVDWVEYSFIINGKEVKIKMPRGQKPLPKEIFEK